jgi:hypothetical protein
MKIPQWLTDAIELLTFFLQSRKTEKEKEACEQKLTDEQAARAGTVAGAAAYEASKMAKGGKE